MQWRIKQKAPELACAQLRPASFTLSVPAVPIAGMVSMAHSSRYVMLMAAGATLLFAAIRFTRDTAESYSTRCTTILLQRMQRLILRAQLIAAVQQPLQGADLRVYILGVRRQQLHEGVSTRLREECGAVKWLPPLVCVRDCRCLPEALTAARQIFQQPY